MRYLIFTFPEKCTVRRKFTATTKIMFISGNQVDGGTTSGIKMSGIRFAICIDGNENTFRICFSLKNALAVCQYDRTKITVI